MNKILSVDAMSYVTSEDVRPSVKYLNFFGIFGSCPGWTGFSPCENNIEEDNNTDNTLILTGNQYAQYLTNSGVFPLKVGSKSQYVLDIQKAYNKIQTYKPLQLSETGVLDAATQSDFKKAGYSFPLSYNDYATIMNNSATSGTI